VNTVSYRVCDIMHRHVASTFLGVSEWITFWSQQAPCLGLMLNVKAWAIAVSLTAFAFILPFEFSAMLGFGKVLFVIPQFLLAACHGCDCHQV